MEKPKPYEPDWEEKKKAEEMMTKKQERDSNERHESYQVGKNEGVKLGREYQKEEEERRRIYDMSDVLYDAQESKKKFRIILRVPLKTEDSEIRSLEGKVDSLGIYSEKGGPGGMPLMEIRTTKAHLGTGFTVCIDSDYRRDYVPVKDIESIELIED